MFFKLFSEFCQNKVNLNQNIFKLEFNNDVYLNVNLICRLNKNWYIINSIQHPRSEVEKTHLKDGLEHIILMRNWHQKI